MIACKPHIYYRIYITEYYWVNQCKAITLLYTESATAQVSWSCLFTSNLLEVVENLTLIPEYPDSYLHNCSIFKWSLNDEWMSTTFSNGLCEILGLRLLWTYPQLQTPQRRKMVRNTSTENKFKSRELTGADGKRRPSCQNCHVL